MKPKILMTLNPRTLKALALIFSLDVFLGSQAFGCPGFLAAEKTFPALEGTRKDIRLYKISASDQWDQVPVQVEPLNEENLLDLPEDQDPMDIKMQPTDRIVYRPEDFGKRHSSLELPCKAKQMLEIKLANDTYGYLVTCNDPSATISRFQQDVTHTQEKFIVESDLYSYQYLENNQLMYKYFSMQDPDTGQRVIGGSDANMLIYLDLRNFFTLALENEQVRSIVSGTWTGPLGTISNVSFYLNLFLLKLDLKMDSSISFYKNSAMIPMKFEAPAHSPNILNEGAGILYYWKNEGTTIDQSQPQNTLPNANTKVALESYKELAKIGLSYCKEDKCKFVLKGELTKNKFAIELVVPKYMVEDGFFPMYVGDTKKFVKDMQWDALQEKAPMIGIYYNNSGLRKGMHEMSQWIRTGEQDFAKTCPEHGEIKRVIIR